MSGRTVSPALVDEIVRRVVEAARPEKVLVFGSAARGETGPESDVDLLVVKGDADPLEVARRIYRNLFGVGAAVDVIVVSPEDLERYRESPGLVVKVALAEGKVVYDAARAATAG